MWIDNNTDNNIFEEDLKYICDFDSTLISALDGTNVLVTGSTGLIGQTFVNAMLYRHLISGNGPFIIAPVRNTEKAYRLYEKQLKLFPELQQ